MKWESFSLQCSYPSCKSNRSFRFRVETLIKILTRRTHLISFNCIAIHFYCTSTCCNGNAFLIIIRNQFNCPGQILMKRLRPVTRAPGCNSISQLSCCSFYQSPLKIEKERCNQDCNHPSDHINHCCVIFIFVFTTPPLFVTQREAQVTAAACGKISQTPIRATRQNIYANDCGGYWSH